MSIGNLAGEVKFEYNRIGFSIRMTRLDPPNEKVEEVGDPLIRDVGT